MDREKNLKYKVGLLAISAALITGYYFSTKDIHRRLEKIRTSIERSDMAVDETSRKFVVYIDANHDRIIDAAELRTALDKMGYKHYIGTATKYVIYDPDRLDYPIFSSEPEKKFRRSDIYPDGDTIYIPVLSAQRLLSE